MDPAKKYNSILNTQCIVPIKLHTTFTNKVPLF
jgi:hypothetical protein